jgi:hypothetical protein
MVCVAGRAWRDIVGMDGSKWNATVKECSRLFAQYSWLQMFVRGKYFDMLVVMNGSCVCLSVCMEKPSFGHLKEVLPAAIQYVGRSIMFR